MVEEIKGIPHDPGQAPPARITPVHVTTNILFTVAGLAILLFLSRLFLLPQPLTALLGASAGTAQLLVVGAGVLVVGIYAAVLVKPSDVRRKYAQWHLDHEAWEAYQHQKQITALNRQKEIAQVKKNVIDAHDDLAITTQTPRVDRTLDLNELQHAVALLTQRQAIQGLQENLEDTAWEREHTRAWRRLDAQHLMRVLTGILEPPLARPGLPPPPPRSASRRAPEDIGAEMAARVADKAAAFAAARLKLQEREQAALDDLARAGHGPGTPVYDQTKLAFGLAAQQLRVDHGLE